MNAYARIGQQGWVLPEELGSAQQSWDLDEGSLFLAKEIGSLVPGLQEREQRALLFLLVAVLLNQRRGSTRLPLDPSGRVLEQLLDDLGAPPADQEVVRELLREGEGSGGKLAPILGGPDAFKPLILDRGQLYIQRMHRAELELIEALRRRMERALELAASGAAQRSVEAAVAEVLAAPPMLGGVPIRLSDEQQAAMRLALRSSMSVISGGPGTGKTSIVVSILRAMIRLGVDPHRIALAAPTGKAANRMAESIRSYLEALAEPDPADRLLIEASLEPRTLHRLLMWSPSQAKFRHDESNPLVEEVVIVDEASMIDLVLMGELLGAVGEDAKLILLGDAEQLPSVDAGAVLRDLVPGEDPRDRRAVLSARLTWSYRMDSKDPLGRKILKVAEAINRGQVGRLLGELDAEAGVGSDVGDFDEAAIRLRRSVGELAFEGVELFESRDGLGLAAFLERWWEEGVAGLAGFEALIRGEYHWDGGAFASEQLGDLERLFRHFESMRLLSVTRSAAAPTGAAAINEALHQRALDAHGAQRDLAFIPGEPVMMLRNDYARGLFNGDQGLILRVREEGEAGHRFRVVFPRGDGFAIFPLEALRGQLSLAYAMTVHKSQGSEFDRVGLILPDAPIPLLTREILYTAVTRSRRSVAVVGRREVLAAGTQRKLERHSGVGAALG